MMPGACVTPKKDQQRRFKRQEAPLQSNSVPALSVAPALTVSDSSQVNLAADGSIAVGSVHTMPLVVAARGLGKIHYLDQAFCSKTRVDFSWLCNCMVCQQITTKLLRSVVDWKQMPSSLSLLSWVASATCSASRHQCKLRTTRPTLTSQVPPPGVHSAPRVRTVSVCFQNGGAMVLTFTFSKRISAGFDTADEWSSQGYSQSSLDVEPCLLSSPFSPRPMLSLLGMYPLDDVVNSTAKCPCTDFLLPL